MQDQRYGTAKVPLKLTSMNFELMAGMPVDSASAPPPDHQPRRLLPARQADAPEARRVRRVLAAGLGGRAVAAACFRLVQANATGWSQREVARLENLDSAFE